ncbi:mitotic spindle assembly checkpoint protein MAD1-like [Xenia sp. Carnegie-2017]|uniref:mitotic spindle assembly checkpoint protein MAD1-like n=1 Tax=Xenia sp. Carnegie-2017 TaxID=2897299 RepID=UPI001F033C9C|nr:mitotic spindle assembly checkpoint protein MAD1-like [Xenia sp. Carnegie-2017]
MWATPDDCTTVVRIMQEYDKLESERCEDEPSKFSPIVGRLTFDENSPHIDNTSLYRSQVKNRSGHLDSTFCQRDYKDREKDVALLCAKGRISHLENESLYLKTERKRSRIDEEKEIEIRKESLRQEIEKNSELQQQLKYVVEEEKCVRDKLKETKKQFEDYKKKTEEKIHGLQRQILKLNSEIEESKEDFWKQITELKEKSTRQETENFIAENKLEDCKNQLDYYKKRYSEAITHVDEMEESHAKYKGLQHKVEELEEKLARCEEASEVAMTMQSQISKYNEIECQNSKLKEENLYLKVTTKNNALLNEKLESCSSKLKRAEKKLKSLEQLEVKYEEQRAFIKKWEVAGVDGIMRSPDELVQEIARLQKAQVVLLQKHGEASTSARISSEALRQQSEELLELKLKQSDLEEKNNEQNEQLKRLNKLLSLVSTERNGCRRLLNSYDGGDPSNYSPQLSSRVKMAEEQLQTCNNYVENLENDLKATILKNSEARMKYNQLKIKYDDLMNPNKTPYKNVEEGSSNTDENQSVSRDVVAKLQSENKQLQEKIDILETRIEQRNLQGDYDPSKIKVVHFSHNPFTHARQARSSELENMRQECETLRKKVKMLEEGPNTSVSKVEQIIIEEASPHEVKDLQEQLSSAERRNKRLKEVFAQKIQEFREACYSLTGYRIDVVQDQQYKLQSMYAERSSDSLLFQCNANGKTMLLETDFSHQVKNLIDQYLIHFNSIPAFLSSVTLELFEKQTQMIN